MKAYIFTDLQTSSIILLLSTPDKIEEDIKNDPHYQEWIEGRNAVARTEKITSQAQYNQIHRIAINAYPQATEDDALMLDAIEVLLEEWEEENEVTVGN